MKKVGIITFHCADNFGAVLQVYALQEKVRQLGFEVEVIDFKPDRILDSYSLFPNIIRTYKKRGFIRTVKHSIFKIKHFKKNYLRKKNFNNFRNEHLNKTKTSFSTSSDLHKFKPNFNYYITGSDQVWNPDFFKEIGETYFLDFAPDDAVKISYAASIAKHVDEDEAKVFKKNLKRFDYISIREKSHIDFISQFTNKNVMVTLDPTLLLSKKDWLKIASNRKSLFKYILVYDLVKNPLIIETANKVAQFLNCKIVSYSSRKGYLNWHSSFYSNNPTEFLGLIDNAEFIITSSFHGTAFSIIFNKPFYTVPHHTRGNRMKDLLNELGLAERLIENHNDIQKINVNHSINYEQINEKLLELKRTSNLFIEEALGISR